MFTHRSVYFVRKGTEIPRCPTPTWFPVTPQVLRGRRGEKVRDSGSKGSNNLTLTLLGVETRPASPKPSLFLLERNGTPVDRGPHSPPATLGLGRPLVSGATRVSVIWVTSPSRVVGMGRDALWCFEIPSRTGSFVSRSFKTVPVASRSGWGVYVCEGRRLIVINLLTLLGVWYFVFVNPDAPGPLRPGRSRVHSVRDPLPGTPETERLSPSPLVPV